MPSDHSPDTSSLVVLRGGSELDPLLDVACGPALMAEVVRRKAGTHLRLVRPAATVAFSGRDCVSPGIENALLSARRHDFVPVRRGPGGRAVAYHRHSLSLDVVGLDDGRSIQERFADLTQPIVTALQSLGVPARLGPVDGEYCFGHFSVNDSAGRKLVGTAQRIVPGGWLFSAMVVISEPGPIRAVLESVYDDLAVRWDPASVGSLSDSVPGLAHDDVVTAMVQAFLGPGRCVEMTTPSWLIEAARSRQYRHLPWSAGRCSRNEWTDR